MGASLHQHDCLWQIVVFGRSLGGAVALHLAATNPGAINSLIVENTFLSIEAVTGKVNMAAIASIQDSACQPIECSQSSLFDYYLKSRICLTQEWWGAWAATSLLT